MHGKYHETPETVAAADSAAAFAATRPRGGQQEAPQREIGSAALACICLLLLALIAPPHAAPSIR
jgi:hypothetical protein